MVNLGGLGGTASGIIRNIAKYSVWAVVAGSVVALAYFIIRLLQYKYKVVIISKRGEGSKVVTDKGAMLRTKDGVWYLKLLKHRTIVKPVDNKYIGADNTIFLRHLGEDLYFPFVLSFDEAKELALIKNIEYDETLTWFFSFKKLVHDKYGYRDWLKEYAPYITIGVVMFVFLISAYYLHDMFLHSASLCTNPRVIIPPS
jgi:hypothetical protein